MDSFEQHQYKLPSWQSAIKTRDAEEIEKFNKNLRYLYAREHKLRRHYSWRGNSMQPFNIEPLESERTRLVEYMTDEQRAARKQWVKDQIMTQERQYVPEMYPRNVFRRIMGAPWDALFTLLRPLMTDRGTHVARYYTPKVFVGIVGVLLMWHNLKYKHRTWEMWVQGWSIVYERPSVYESDLEEGEDFPERALDTFGTHGYQDRVALRGSKLITTRDQCDVSNPSKPAPAE